MTMTMFVSVLCLGLFPIFAANRLRYFEETDKRVEFSLEPSGCNKTKRCWITLFDEDDLNFAKNFARCTLGNWLGLYKKTPNNLTWSNGEKITFSNSSVSIKPGVQICEAIEDGRWIGFNCSERKSFVCQKGKNFTLRNQKKNWCQALKYCRTHFRDLASINNELQNEELRSMSWNNSFWIGLQHDEWKWADESCSTYRGEFKVVDSSFNCTKFARQLSYMMPIQCQDNEFPELFSSGNVRIKLIKEPKTWEEALDHCQTHYTRLLWIEDQEDQNAVNQWLNSTKSTHTDSLWIGLRQSSVFGFWIWSDRMVNWNNWKNGTPPEVHPVNQCGVVNATSYEWMSENCWERLSFLCEEDIFYMNYKAYG